MPIRAVGLERAEALKAAGLSEPLSEVQQN
jgi:hypothetical protein